MLAPFPHGQEKDGPPVTTISIVRPGRTDRAEWRRLFQAYADFYRVAMDDQIAETTWQWIHDPAHVLEGVIARQAGGAVVGLAHFRAMPSPLRGIEIGFLDDLFVDPSARGEQVGEALLQHVAAEGRARGWPKIRWITADDNYRARTLYDRVAAKTLWNVYEMIP